MVTTTVGPSFCTNPPAIANGVVLSSGPYFKNGSRAVIDCLSGFILDGSTTLTCSTSGWSSPLPVCVPEDKNPKIDTDVDVKVEPNSDNHTYFLALVILGGILCVVLTGLLIAWCVHMTGCCHGNVVLPYMGNYRQTGCCCCKRFVIVGDQRPTQTDSNTKMTRTKPDNGYVNGPKTLYRIESDDKIVRPENETTKSGTNEHDAKKPAVWMPHTNSVRNINTSTK